MNYLLLDLRGKKPKIKNLAPACAARLLDHGAITLREHFRREALKWASIAGLPSSVRKRALKLAHKLSKETK